MRENLFKIPTALVIAIMVFNISSCSDSGITNISKEQLKEHSIMLDGPGSKIINEEEQPLWVLNDKVISSEFLIRIKPKHIDSISVLKGDAAIEYYGKDGKNGVVKIYANKKIFTDLEPDTSEEGAN